REKSLRFLGKRSKARRNISDRCWRFIAFPGQIESFCWLKRSRMVDRLARVLAQLYGHAGRSISRPVSANP
ncbi:hypothetical protein ACCS94_35655, partial [Rhizobium johnstonii]